MEIPAINKDATDCLLHAASFQIDDWPTFASAIDRTAVTFGRMISELIPTPLSLRISEVISGVSSDLIDAAQPQLSCLLRADNWDENLLACAPRSSIFAMTEALFGGDGTAAAYEAERECTRVEVAAAELLFLYLGAALQSSFAHVADPNMSTGTCTSDVVLDSVGGAGASIVLVRFSGEVIGRPIELSVAISQTALLSMRDLLQDTATDHEENSDPKWTKHFDRQLRQTEVKLTALLDGGQKTLDEISRLRAGQVLELPSDPNTLVKVHCNDHTLLLCHLGQSDGAFVLRVEQFADAEQDFMEELLAGKAGVVPALTSL